MPSIFTKRFTAPLAAVAFAVTAVMAAAPALAETREMVMAAPRDLAPGPESAWACSRPRPNGA